MITPATPMPNRTRVEGSGTAELLANAGVLAARATSRAAQAILSDMSMRPFGKSGCDPASDVKFPESTFRRSRVKHALGAVPGWDAPSNLC